MPLLIHVHPSTFLTDGLLHTPDGIYGHFRITSKANMHVLRLWVPGENPLRHGIVCKLHTKEHQLAGAFKPRTMLLWGDNANHRSTVPAQILHMLICLGLTYIWMKRKWTVYSMWLCHIQISNISSIPTLKMSHFYCWRFKRCKERLYFYMQTNLKPNFYLDKENCSPLSHTKF